MSDVSVRATAITPAPMDYKVPGSQEIAPKSVAASMDGTSASVPWFPCLQLLDPAGNVMFSAVSSTSLAAGVSADVSWFPRVGGGSSVSVSAVVGARISATVTQNIPNATATDLVYDTVDFDTAGMTNLGADDRKLTVTVGGLYLVTCSVVWTYNSAGGRLCNVTHNAFYAPLASSVGGDERPAVWASPIGGSGGAPRTSNTATVLVDAAAGDFFASGCGQYSGGTLACNGVANGNVNNYLSAILLGEIV